MGFTITDTGSSHAFNGPTINLPISSSTILVPPISFVLPNGFPTGVQLIAEFGAYVEEPSGTGMDLPQNFSEIFGTVGVRSNDIDLDRVVLYVTRTNTSLLGAPEEFVYSVYQTIQAIGFLAPVADQNITFSFYDGGNGSNLQTGYYRYRLYITSDDTTVVTTPASVVGPIQFGATNYTSQ